MPRVGGCSAQGRWAALAVAAGVRACAPGAQQVVQLMRCGAVVVCGGWTRCAYLPSEGRLVGSLENGQANTRWQCTPRTYGMCGTTSNKLARWALVSGICALGPWDLR